MTDVAPAAPGTPDPAPGAPPPAAAPAAAPATILGAGGDAPPAPGAAPPPAAALVPEKYDLKLPEDTLFDPAALEGIGAFARDLGLTQEEAQKLVERDNALLGEFTKHIDTVRQTAWADQVKQWADTVQADPELGGANFQQTKFYADKFMRTFATPAFREAVEKTGFGNHPELVRVIAKAGRMLGEDQPPTSGGGDGTHKDPAKILFPSMN